MDRAIWLWQEDSDIMALKPTRRGGESLKGLTARYDKKPFDAQTPLTRKDKVNRKSKDKK